MTPQVQSVYQGAVRAELSSECKEEAKKTVPAEFTSIRHERGILSMGRMSDPDSGGSSFSMVLGDARHLDNQYTVFGRVLEGAPPPAATSHLLPRGRQDLSGGRRDTWARGRR